MGIQTLQSEILDCLQPFLACPHCHCSLTLAGDLLNCPKCDVGYAIRDGIPDLAVTQGTETWTVNSPLTSDYQQRYTHDSAADIYQQSFHEVSRKRSRTQRELDILQRLLDGMPHVASIINIPCGGGRLSVPISEACDLLIEADIAFEQLAYARTNVKYQGNTTWLSASAFHLPLQRRSVDGIVCARLSHHLCDEQDQIRLLQELCRVAEQFVILSFTDSLSTKTVSRWLRGKPVNPATLNCGRIEKYVSQFGFQLKTVETVSAVGSRHRYALLTRD